MLENHEPPPDEPYDELVGEPHDEGQRIAAKIIEMNYFLDNNSKDPARHFEEYLNKSLAKLSPSQRVKLLSRLMDELDNMDVVLQNSFNESVANHEQYKTNSQILGLEGEDERQILQLTLEKFQKIISQHASANNQSINHRPRQNDD